MDLYRIFRVPVLKVEDHIAPGFAHASYSALVSGNRCPGDMRAVPVFVDVDFFLELCDGVAFFGEFAVEQCDLVVTDHGGLMKICDIRLLGGDRFFVLDDRCFQPGIFLAGLCE